MAETQTVLWMRQLDRLRGPDRPRLVVVDPRRTPAAREADVHLPLRPGTNVALLNALLHELVVGGWADLPWLERHTVGFDALAATVAPYTPEAAAEIGGVPADDVRAAARILGEAERLVSFVLQGVYQSHQATAAACQVNNLHLLRGMIGRPGAAVFQMNGQPTAQTPARPAATAARGRASSSSPWAASTARRRRRPRGPRAAGTRACRATAAADRPARPARAACDLLGSCDQRLAPSPSGRGGGAPVRACDSLTLPVPRAEGSQTAAC